MEHNHILLVEDNPTDAELAEIYSADYYSQFGYRKGAADAALARVPPNNAHMQPSNPRSLIPGPTYVHFLPLSAIVWAFASDSPPTALAVPVSRCVSLR